MEKKTRHTVEIAVSLLVAGIYTLLPTDLVPDIAPVAGWIDDAIVVLLAVANTIRLLRKRS